VNRERQKAAYMLQKFVRYGIVGIVGTVMYIGLLALLVNGFGLEPVVTSVFIFVFVLWVSYILNYFWTFRASRGHAEVFPRFIIVSVFGLLINTGIMYITIDILRWWYLWGVLISIFFVPCSNFLLNTYWTFSAIR
jgi:putative flippase GtrA